LSYQPYAGLCPYGSLSLTAKSPVQSFTEPISLAQARKYLNLPERDPLDYEEEDEIETFISAAREVAEVMQGRDLVRKQWDLSLDYFYSYGIELRDPLVSVDLFKYRDSGGGYTTLVENTDYLVDATKHPGIVTPPFNSFWPGITGWPTGAVLIRFTSGYASDDAFWSDAGKRLIVGMKMLISAWYNGRLPFDAVRDVSEYPYAVTALLGFGAQRNVR
jgi:uncharacterized phiE125 gp8 family phage protein